MCWNCKTFFSGRFSDDGDAVLKHTGVSCLSRAVLYWVHLLAVVLIYDTVDLGRTLINSFNMPIRIPNYAKMRE